MLERAFLEKAIAICEYHVALCQCGEECTLEKFCCGIPKKEYLEEYIKAVEAFTFPEKEEAFCSVCGYQFPEGITEMKFCPICGEKRGEGILKLD